MDSTNDDPDEDNQLIQEARRGKHEASYFSFLLIYHDLWQGCTAAVVAAMFSMQWPWQLVARVPSSMKYELARQARAQAYVVDRTMTSIKVNPATMEATMYYAC